MIRHPAFQWTLLAIAICAYLYFPVWTVAHAINNNDFKHIYFGMKALLDGSSPYPLQSLHHQAALQGYRRMAFNPYVYLPFTGQVMSFLSPFPLSQATLVWFFLNHLFVAGVVIILSRMFSSWRIAAAALLLLSLTFSVPLYRTLTAGQLNLALLFMICLAWRQAHRERPAWCGSIIAFAALFKLMPGIYALYFLINKKWRALSAMIVTGLTLLAISIIMAGPGLYLEFFPILGQMGYGKSTWPHVFSFWDDPTNQSLNSFFSHIFTHNDHTTPWIAAGQSVANIATILATIMLFAAYAITIGRNRPTTVTQNQFNPTNQGAWCATLILALLIPSLLWDHYLVMLILPVAWMIRTGISLRNPAPTIAVFLLYMITCIPWDFAAPQWRSGPGILLMSLKLWPTIALFGLNLCFIRWQATNVSPAPTDESGSSLRDSTIRENTCRP